MRSLFAAIRQLASRLPINVTLTKDISGNNANRESSSLVPSNSAREALCHDWEKGSKEREPELSRLEFIGHNVLLFAKKSIMPPYLMQLFWK